ncbi:hypothetical protein P3X46_025544 [Hevea brasiliensis]|uniref:CASP-like protein n=1 Tax=Hevea brasiliensis TaxID=3981 RepID=A0ABQ9L8M2_HEVBR|nr:CASP-like protein 4D1 [Hevea brasiliensis]KAJ9160113.1 hypothetical protein P3X46_025544 [Hevea brasiliensis]
MAASFPSKASGVIPLVLRVLTFICLLASLIILTTNTATLVVNLVEFKIHFNDIYSYRYLLATIVIGFAYTILQILFALCYAATGKRFLGGDRNLLFDFYGDKVISYLLATGVAAGFAATKDLKPLFVALGAGDVVQFFNKGYASAGLLLIGFVCTAISSVLSSYALPKQF